MAGMIKARRTRKSLVSHWKNKAPREKALIFIKKFGKPKFVSKNRVEWHNIRPFKRVWIKDEKIAHSFPVKKIKFSSSFFAAIL